MTHIWVGNLTIIGSDNGLWPGRRQAIIWTNAGILLIEPLGTNFSEILIGIQIFSFKKMRWKMAAILSRPQCVNIIDMWCGRRGICAHFMSIITGYMRTVSTNGEHVYLYNVFPHWLGPFPGDPIHQTRDGADTVFTPTQKHPHPTPKDDFLQVGFQTINLSGNWMKMQILIFHFHEIHLQI